MARKLMGILLILTALNACTAMGLLLTPEHEIENKLEHKYGSQVYSEGMCNSIEHGCFAPKYYNEWTTPSGEVKCQCQ